MKHRRLQKSELPVSPKSNKSSSESIESFTGIMEFKKEIEEKFFKSITNCSFKFPKKMQKSNNQNQQKCQSNDSLKDVCFYDLNSEAIKYSLMHILKSKDKSDSEILTEVITKLGSLDTKYLQSQFKNCESSLFRILSKSVQNKVDSSLKEKEQKQLCLTPVKPEVIVSTKNPYRFNFHQNRADIIYQIIQNKGNSERLAIGPGLLKQQTQNSTSERKIMVEQESLKMKKAIISSNNNSKQKMDPSVEKMNNDKIMIGNNEGKIQQKLNKLQNKFPQKKYVRSDKFTEKKFQPTQEMRKCCPHTNRTRSC